MGTRYRGWRFAFSAAAAVGALLVCGSPADADIISDVTVSTSFGEELGPSATGSGSIDFTGTSQFNSATGHGSAYAYFSYNPDYDIPLLGVEADGTAAREGNEVTPGNAIAVATLQGGSLRYDHPNIVDPSFLGLNPYLYFVYRLSGSISNHMSGSVMIAVTTPDGTEFDKSLSFQGPGPTTGVATLRLPGNALLGQEGEEGDMYYPTFSLSLGVSGGTDDQNQDGRSDISHTLAFDTAYFGDANGNPNPGGAGVQIDTEAGPMAVTTVPEPTLGCVATGATLALLARRRRSRC